MSVLNSYSVEVGLGRLMMSQRTTSTLQILLVLTALLWGPIGTAPANDITPAASPDIVISHIYGGGGNAGATLRNDFVEIFNRGSTTISVTGWTIQYASASGSSWTRADLTGSIPPGGYHLVQLHQGTGGTQNLPAPDSLASINLSATAGKVALVRNSTLLSGSCPLGGAVADFVGYGDANCSEGGTAPGLNNMTAAIRGGGGCTDTDNNAQDFTSGSPNPRNSSAPVSPCGPVDSPIPLTGSGSATPASIQAGASVLLTVTVAPATQPNSTGITVTADLRRPREIT